MAILLGLADCLQNTFCSKVKDLTLYSVTWRLNFECDKQANRWWNKKVKNKSLPQSCCAYESILQDTVVWLMHVVWLNPKCANEVSKADDTEGFIATGTFAIHKSPYIKIFSGHWTGNTQGAMWFPQQFPHFSSDEWKIDFGKKVYDGICKQYFPSALIIILAFFPGFPALDANQFSNILHCWKIYKKKQW